MAKRLVMVENEREKSRSFYRMIMFIIFLILGVYECGVLIPLSDYIAGQPYHELYFSYVNILVIFSIISLAVAMPLTLMFKKIGIILLLSNLIVYLAISLYSIIGIIKDCFSEPSSRVYAVPNIIWYLIPYIVLVFFCLPKVRGKIKEIWFNNEKGT